MSKHHCAPTLEKYLKILSPTEKNDFLPLKDQAQIPFILDTLSRKNHHHIIIFGSASEKFNFSFLTSLAQQQEAYFLHWDIIRMLASSADIEQIEHDFMAFAREISANNRHVILAVNQLDPFLNTDIDPVMDRLAKLLKPLLLNNQWRLVVVATTQHPRLFNQYPQLPYFFSTVKLNEPTTIDTINILKIFRDEMESFHHVVIPDETILYALSMANHYLSSAQPSLEKTLQLLDSGAARVSSQERTDIMEHKPILTNSTVAHIVSSWTKIPITHLQHNKFKAFDFMHGLQKNIFGQDAAINLISLALQYARIKLHNKTGPLCSFLFAGPSNVGKTETALAVVEQLFGHRNALLHVNLDKAYHPLSLADIKVTPHGEENHYISLFEAIQESPYAVVLLENINLTPPGAIDLFYDLLIQGFALDEHGNKYDFRHAIIIITTTLGSERIIRLTQPPVANDTAQTVDLMQLMLNEPVQNNSSPQQPNPSSQELCEELMPALETYFSIKLLRQLNIIPFTLLDYAGIEKIIRLKLKALAKQLETNFGIELTYSPEVLRFLVQETLWRGEATRPIDKALEQHLYSCVAQELLSHVEDKNRPKRLLLQLNDAGQLLRCEFVLPAEATLYQL